MFLRLLLMFIILLVVGIMVSSNCSRFLVFRMWVSIVAVNVNTNFFVFGGNDKADLVSMCCNDVYSFCVGVFIIFLEVNPDIFFFYNQCKDIYIFCPFTEFTFWSFQMFLVSPFIYMVIRARCKV